MHDGSAIFDRIHIAQIIYVDWQRGKMRLRHQGVDHNVAIPVDIVKRGANSAWRRFIPQKGTFAILAFDAKKQPICCGLTTFGTPTTGQSDAAVNGPTGAGPSAGYAAYHDGYRVLLEAGRIGTAGLSQMEPLQPGEWDMRSSGGALIMGTIGGVLRGSAGLSRFALEKGTGDARWTGGTRALVESGTGGAFWIGNVKRTVPNPIDPSSLYKPTDLSTIPAPLVEGLLAVEANTPAGVTFKRYEQQAGDLFERDSIIPGPPIPVVTTAGTPGPLRFRERTFEPSGLIETMTRKVDLIGNVEETALLTHSTKAPTIALGGDAIQDAATGLSLIAKADATATAIFSLAQAIRSLTIALQATMAAGSLIALPPGSMEAITELANTAASDFVTVNLAISSPLVFTRK